MEIEETRDSIINKICLHLIPTSKTKEKDVELFIDKILQTQQKEIEQLKKSNHVELLSKASKEIIRLEKRESSLDRKNKQKGNEIFKLKEQLKECLVYIEKADQTEEWEWGSCRSLQQVIEANEMPDIYNNIKQLLTKKQD